MDTSDENRGVWYGYLNVDERSDAVGALEMTVLCLEAAETDPQRMWKWAVIALHNAVQAFMVLALKSTWNVRVLQRDQRKKKVEAERAYRRAIEAGNDADAEAAFAIMIAPDGDLAAFIHLYQRIKDPKGAMRQFTHSRHFEPRPSDDQCMECLNNIRNELMHFVPNSWHFLLKQFPAITKTGLHVIGFLLNKSNNITWYPGLDDQDLEVRAAAALARGNEAAARLSAAYADYPLPRTPLCGSPREG